LNSYNYTISYLDPNKAAQEFTPGFELKHPKRQAKGVIIRVQTGCMFSYTLVRTQIWNLYSGTTISGFADSKKKKIMLTDPRFF
jgi:hypothetical protein